MDALEEANAAYRDARDSVAPHLRKQADAEIARARWLRKRRGVPSELLYAADTGDAIDPDLVQLDAAVTEAESDVVWCRAVEVACMEVIKGKSLDDIIAGNTAGRARIEELRANMPAPGIHEVSV